MPQKEVHIVKAVVFPVVMNGCDSWTIKMVEHPGLVHWEDPEDWGGVGGGWGDQDGEYM